MSIQEEIVDVKRFEELTEDQQNTIIENSHEMLSFDWLRMGQEAITCLMGGHEHYQRLEVTGRMSRPDAVGWNENFEIVSTQFEIVSADKKPTYKFPTYEHDFKFFTEHVGLTIQEWLAYLCYAQGVSDLHLEVEDSGLASINDGNFRLASDRGDDEFSEPVDRWEITKQIAEDVYDLEWCDDEDDTEYETFQPVTPNSLGGAHVEVRDHPFFEGAPITDFMPTPEDFTDTFESAISKILVWFNQFLKEAQRTLEAECEYLHSREYFQEMAEANDWVFVRRADEPDSDYRLL